MKEALFYDKIDERNRVKCGICPRRCVIAPGKRGECETRLNSDGKLYTLIYELVSSMSVDPIEKKPMFHFYPGSKALSLGTFGCNFHCKHCQNWQISYAKPDETGSELTHLPVLDIVKTARKYHCQGVTWTYNEPIIWFEYTLDGARISKQHQLYTGFVTNGYITSEALDVIGPYLDAFRVDLKGFTNELYYKLAGIKDFTPVLESTKRAKKKWGMHIEVVTNIIPTWNDDDEQLRGIARWIHDNLGADTPWHVTRFIPYLDLSHLNPTPVETLEKARRIGMEEGLNFVYLGNVPGHQGENTYCPNCKETVIERTGFYISSYQVKEGKCKFCGRDLNIIE